MAATIKIGKINERIEWAMRLIDFCYLHNEQDSVSLVILLQPEKKDRKRLKKIYSGNLWINRILNFIFRYKLDLKLSKTLFDNNKDMLYKYFASDWRLSTKNLQATFLFRQFDLRLHVWDPEYGRLLMRFLQIQVHERIIEGIELQES